MSEVFDHAAVRHWHDACLLESEERLPNSDQLFGIAAECAIKFALAQMPNCVQAGRLAKHYREHVDVLWDQIPLQNLQKRFPGLVAVAKANKPFADWSTDQRYEPDASISPAAVQSHREATKRLLGSLSLLGRRQRSS